MTTMITVKGTCHATMTTISVSVTAPKIGIQMKATQPLRRQGLMLMVPAGKKK